MKQSLFKPACKRLACFSLSLLTMACTPPAVPTLEQGITTQKKTTMQNKTATNLTAWTITGAIAAKQKKKTWTASLSWQQQGSNQYLLRLFGPLGGGSVIIEKKGALTIYRDGQKTRQSIHAEQLLAQETGIHLPISHLYYWVRGMPAPSAPHTSQRNPEGHLLQLNQAGYTLHYSAYTQVNEIALPTKIQLDSPEGTVKLVIKHWQLQS